jgi:pimeloyl-ACP methyl ester carboxylesterase
VNEQGKFQMSRRHFSKLVTAGAASASVVGLSATSASAAVRSAAGGAGLAAASTSFGPLKQIRAGVPDIGYVEAGPASGPPSQLRRGDAAAGRAGLPGHRPVHARPRHDSTSRGVPGLKANRAGIAEIIWKFNSPDWKFSPATCNTTAAPAIGVPTVTVDGAQDPFTPAGDGSAYRAHFTGRHAHVTLPVGHNVPQEDPAGFAAAVVQAGHL